MTANSQKGEFPKLSISVADIPINISWPHLFSEARDLDFDGVEIVSGIKSRFELANLTAFQSKYQLPILSMHQSFWSLLGPETDTEIKLCADLGADYVIHSPFWQKLDGRETISYLEKVSSLARKYSVTVLLENAPSKFILPFFRWFKPDESAGNLTLLQTVCDLTGLSMVIDVSHLGSRNPPTPLNNKKMWEGIRNVHLSDYRASKQHLPLGQGRLNLGAYITMMKNYHYKRIVTFEFSPQLYVPESKYLSEITSSLELFRRLYALG